MRGRKFSGLSPSTQAEKKKEGAVIERRNVLAAGLALAAGSTLAAPAIAQTQPSIRWRLTSSFPKSLETIYGGGEFFAERVNKLTDGKFNIRVFAAGDIVPAFRHSMPSNKARSNSATRRPTITSAKTSPWVSERRCHSVSPRVSRTRGCITAAASIP